MGLTGLFRKNKTNTVPLSKIRLLIVGDISPVMLSLMSPYKSLLHRVIRTQVYLHLATSIQ